MKKGSALMNSTAALCFVAMTVCAAVPEKPNILWITSEDNGIWWVSCYGSENCNTPAIDNLAKEGFRYAYCFDNAAVCAPTRSTWITGMYAVSNGTQPMRSRNAIPHDRIPYYPDLLKQAGYFVTNCTKTDYNIGGRPDQECWDISSRDAQYGWRKRKEDQPFFAIMNIGSSHESRAHGDAENTQHDPSKMKLHQYHPDLPEIRKSYAKYADAVEKMDSEVQATIDALKEDGLYEDTIIIYNSDHGGVMPRSKRFIYSTGIHCPLVIRIPEKWKEIWPADKPGATVDRLVSFVDMPKTWLSLAGAEIVDTLQGTVFLGKDIEPEPGYHFAFRERADDRVDHVRVMRTKRYAYHRNYMPYAPAGQYLSYMFKINAAPAWEQYFKEGKADAITGRFFRPRVSEEFYDNEADFDNVNNLINDPKYQNIIDELKQELRRKQLQLFDSGLLPEEMRMQRAKDNNMTIYEMVRDPKLYPLEKYLDAADLALARDKSNLARFIRDLSDADSGMRFWAVTGLLLLDADAAPAADALAETLQDAYVEVSSLAAWSLCKIGRREEASQALYEMLVSGKGWRPLYNVLDWMGDDSDAILERYARDYTAKETLLKDIITRRGIEIASVRETGTKRSGPKEMPGAVVIPAETFSTAEGADRSKGLKAEYFGNSELSGKPAFIAVDEKIDFEWGKGAPHDLPPDSFSIRWTGKITVPARGKYTFVTHCDDGSRLWIDNKLIVDNWQGGAARDVSGTARLGAGKAYDIKMEFFEHRGGATAKLKWIEPE